MQANNPWVVKLYSSFQDDLYLYLVMEVYQKRVRESDEASGHRLNAKKADINTAV